MPTIEIVVYNPKNMAEFIEYCINGKPNSTTEPLTGVFDWLRGRTVPEAHFFHNDINDTNMKLFAATIQRPEANDVPWMGNLPGFEDMIELDGLIGNANKFTPLADLLATVKSDTKMDDLYRQLKDALDRLLDKIDEDPEFLEPIGKEQLLAALRGEPGVNRKDVFAEVARKYPEEAGLIIGPHRLPA